MCHPVLSGTCNWCYLYGVHTVSSAFYHLKDQLQPLYDEREAASIAHEVLQHITGLSRTQRLIQKGMQLSEMQQQAYDSALLKLQAGVPLQYVTGIAWFMGHEYHVDANTLIPRPETEELVQWIVDDHKNRSSLRILDIGTGSGCIPIELGKRLQQADVTTCDISAGAISVAQQNASILGALVQFLQIDFLDHSVWNALPRYDIIVSNPPYIPRSEKERLHINVRDNEPELALFVPDEDALVFYRAIATFGKDHLEAGGHIYCELDAGHGVETKELFENTGYTEVILRKDIHGNDRMLRALWT